MRHEIPVLLLFLAMKLLLVTGHMVLPCKHSVTPGYIAWNSVLRIISAIMVYHLMSLEVPRCRECLPATGCRTLHGLYMRDHVLTISIKRLAITILQSMVPSP